MPRFNVYVSKKDLPVWRRAVTAAARREVSLSTFLVAVLKHHPAIAATLRGRAEGKGSTRHATSRPQSK